MKPMLAVVVATSLSVSLPACTLAIPTAWALATDRYNNDERQAALAANRSPVLRRYEPRVFGGLAIGAAIDTVIVLAFIAYQFQHNTY